ncbi:MAG: hypothetical protein KZQ70_08330 [gamma proteobacterium symbiont of Lucinoma myriamae]|nr:hypothetical protein [gamma proteobacterium symbiont of Lucinoma myriamae]MCU7817365.1 hypothetical protein [gamma proteobacterium symbiont of Lucinoma myriamae]MCU7832533.1 hypothetical protein [gamma proteobacterium symbiont of Lucinoma myriamae]
METEKKSIEKNEPVKKGTYKVVFKGRLLPDFDRNQVITNIAQLTKLPAEKIENKFFNGKVVIIRRAHDNSHALKLQQLFTKAGLEVFILQDVEQEEIEQDDESIMHNEMSFQQIIMAIKKRFEAS